MISISRVMKEMMTLTKWWWSWQSQHNWSWGQVFENLEHWKLELSDLISRPSKGGGAAAGGEGVGVRGGVEWGGWVEEGE